MNSETSAPPSDGYLTHVSDQEALYSVRDNTKTHDYRKHKACPHIFLKTLSTEPSKLYSCFYARLVLYLGLFLRHYLRKRPAIKAKHSPTIGGDLYLLLKRVETSILLRKTHKKLETQGGRIPHGMAKKVPQLILKFTQSCIPSKIAYYH